MCVLVGVRGRGVDKTWMFSGGPTDQAGCERAGWIYGPACITGKYKSFRHRDMQTTVF